MIKNVRKFIVHKSKEEKRYSPTHLPPFKTKRFDFLADIQVFCKRTISSRFNFLEAPEVGTRRSLLNKSVRYRAQ